MSHAYKIENRLSNAINEVKSLLKQIEDMKSQIVDVWSDETLPYSEKTEALERMRKQLRDTEHYTLSVIAGGVCDE